VCGSAVTLLLRLEGPMQSWGTSSMFSNRDTQLEPTKSGVIGLVCAAMGRPRTEPVDDLAGLRFGVRIDNPGAVRRDYQTAGGAYPKFNKRGARVSGTTQATLSDRYFLAGASFVAGFEGDERLLEAMSAALTRPVWQIGLGRKAYVPSLPVLIGPVEESLLSALAAAPLTDVGLSFLRSEAETTATRLRCVLDDEEGEQERSDVPLSFATREFGTRKVATAFVEVQP
jgi:CRISPR system Cascade subunit CasD